MKVFENAASLVPLFSVLTNPPARELCCLMAAFRFAYKIRVIEVSTGACFAVVVTEWAQSFQAGLTFANHGHKTVNRYKQRYLGTEIPE